MSGPMVRISVLEEQGAVERPTEVCQLLSDALKRRAAREVAQLQFSREFRCLHS